MPQLRRGLKDGAVKSFFSLISLLIAIPLAGIFYHLIARALSFIPGSNWENFVGFFITFGIISLVLFFVFFWSRTILQKIWHKGVFFRTIGGTLNLFNAAIGLTLFTILMLAYPIFDWLKEAVAGSAVLVWLVEHLGLVPAMLPELFRDASNTVIARALF